MIFGVSLRERKTISQGSLEDNAGVYNMNQL